MKNKQILTLIALAAIAFAGCKNNDDDSTPKSKKELLTAGSWIMTDYIQAGTSTWADKENCEKDDYFTFKTDGKGTFDEGATKCDPSDPQTETVDWSLSSDESKLTIDGLEQTIAELTETSMILKISMLGFTFESRYKKK